MSEIPAAPPAARLPHAEFVTMVAFLMALNAMAIDVILPALQQMGESLGVTDENARQFPLLAYIAFFGLSQIVYGTDFPYRTAADHSKGVSLVFTGDDLKAIDRENALRILPRLKTA